MDVAPRHTLIGLVVHLRGLSAEMQWQRTPTAWCVLMLLWGGIAIGLCGDLCGQELDAEAAGKQALTRGSYPWYSPQDDSLKRINIRSPKDEFPGRMSDWKKDKKPKPPKNTTAPNSGAGSAFSQVMEVLVWVLASILLAVLVAVLIWAFLNRHQREGVVDDNIDADDDEATARIDRIEELPVPINAIQGDLLQQAKAHYANGNLRDAIICLFSYKLLQLDNQHAIHLERGKTNRQYLRELRTHPKLRQLLEGTMIAFEDVFFGNHDLTNDRFEACLGQVEAFQQAVQSGS